MERITPNNLVPSLALRAGLKAAEAKESGDGALPGSVGAAADKKAGGGGGDPESGAHAKHTSDDEVSEPVIEEMSGRCSKRLIEWPWFDRVVLVMIVVNTVLLAMDNPGIDPLSDFATVLKTLDYIMTAFFTVEMGIKIHGLTARGYFSQSWNILDAIIVVLSDIGVIIQIVLELSSDGGDNSLTVVRTIRVLRVLRPLLLLGHFEGMKLILESVIKSALSIVNVLLLLMFVWLIFAIIGMNLFSGKLYYCTDENIEWRSECTGTFVATIENPIVPRKQLASPLTPIGHMPDTLSRREWVAHQSNFDNIFEAVFTLNEINSFQEWPNTAWIAVDSTEVNQSPQENWNLPLVLYFVLFITLSQYMFMNLFIGVIFTSFQQVKAKQVGKHKMSRRQMCWVHICQMISNSKPLTIPALPPSAIRRTLYRAVLSSRVDVFVSLCIVGNVVTLALTHKGETADQKSNLQLVNTVFTIIFMAEAVIKIVAINWAQYWHRGWNRLDFVLVALSVFDLVIISNIDAPKMNESAFDSRTTVRAMQALRVLRVFRLVRKSVQVKQLFEMIKDSIGYFSNAVLVYMLMLVMFSILAMNLFGNVSRGSYLHDRANFETFGSSMLTLFRAASSDDWNELSYGAGLDAPHCTADSCGNFWISKFFFFVFNIVMALIFMNLLAAVFLENFDDIEMKAKYKVNTDDIRKFQHVWLFFDPSGTGWISLRDVPALLRDVGPPLGVPRRAQNAEILKLVRSAKLKVPNGMSGPLMGEASVLVKSNSVGYYDLIFALAWRVCGVTVRPPSSPLASSPHHCG